MISKLLLAHDVRMAVFEISEKNNAFDLFVRFDREDLLIALREYCPDYNQLTDCFVEYMDSNLNLQFNGQPVELVYDKHLFEQDFVELNFQLKTSESLVKTIKVENTCMIQSMEGHLNIVKSMLNGRSRSFRLDKDRVETIIRY